MNGNPPPLLIRLKIVSAIAGAGSNLGYGTIASTIRRTCSMPAQS
jgi:hypothetical protein